QDYLHEQVPIIGSKRTMLRIIDNLVELELLDKKVKHEKGKVKGTFFYIKPTTKMDSLQDYDPYDRLSKGGRQIVKRGMTKCHNKDTSITDTSITDNKENTSAKLTEDFEKLWNMYPNKQGKKKAKSSYERAIKKGTTNKEIQDGIVRYKKHLKQNDWLKAAHGATWFNNERWEDEYGVENGGSSNKSNWESYIN